MRSIVPALIACLALVSTTASLSGAKLGDPAGALVIKNWVKGKPVDVKDGKNIYVVEFWATWCGPCKTSIPHLTELQNKFKDRGVVFVGISDEPAETVKPFVDKMGEKMDYAVACDDGRKSNAAYMEAYDQGGIPTAFIVGKNGNVLWFGHPMADLESTLDQVLGGKYNVAEAAKKDEARALNAEYQALAAKGDPKASELGEKLIKAAGTDSVALCDLAFGVAANMRNPHRDFALADRALDAAEKSGGAKQPQVVAIRAIVRFESGKETEGLNLAKEAVGLAKDDSQKKIYERYVRVMESRLAQKNKEAKSPEPTK